MKLNLINPHFFSNPPLFFPVFSPRRCGEGQGVRSGKNKKGTLFFLLLILAVLQLSAQEIIMKPANNYLYLLVHGEDGKSKTNSYRLFTSENDGQISEADNLSQTPGNEGLKRFLEQRYNIAGNVFAYQFGNPSASIEILAQEFAEWFSRAQEDWKKNHPNQNPPDRFIIITHSTSGLVVREYLTNLYNPSYKIDLVITVNSPHEGTPYPEVLQELKGRTIGNKLQKVAKNSFDATMASTEAKGLIGDINSYYKYGKAALGIYNSGKDLYDAINSMRTSLASRVDAIQSQAKQVKSDLNASSNLSITNAYEFIQKQLQAQTKISETDIQNYFSKVKDLKPAINSIRIKVLVDNIDLEPWFEWMVMQFGNTFPGDNLSRVITQKDAIKKWLEIDQVKPFLKAKLPENQIPDSDFDVFENDISTALTNNFSKPFVLLSDIQNLKSFLQDVNTSTNTASLPNFNDVQNTIQNKLNSIKIELNLNTFESLTQNISGLKSLQISASNPASIQTAAEKLILILADLQKLTNASSPNAVKVKLGNIKADLEMIGTQLKNTEILKSLGAVETTIQTLQSLKSNLANLGDLSIPAIKTPNMPQNAQLKSIADGCALSLERIDGNVSLENTAFLKFWGLATIARAQNIKIEIETKTANSSEKTPIAILNETKLPDLSDLTIFKTIDDVYELSQNTFTLCQDILDVAGKAKDLKSQVSSIFSKDKSTQTTSSADGGSEPAFNAGDAISVLMMVGSLAKLFGNAEDKMTASAAFNKAIKKFLSEMSKNIWKEVMSGAITEIAFASAVQDKTNISPSDPIMENISKKSDSKVNKMLDSLMKDEKAMPRFAVVYTQGVLTPTMDEASKLGWNGGTAFATDFLKAKVNEIIEAAVSEAKKKIQARVDDAINKGLNQLTNSGEIDLWKDTKITPNIQLTTEYAALLKMDDNQLLSEINANSNLRSQMANISKNMSANLASIAGIDQISLSDALKNKDDLGKYLDLSEAMNNKSATFDAMRMEIAILSNPSSQWQEMIKKHYAPTDVVKAKELIPKIRSCLQNKDLAGAMMLAGEIGAQKSIKNIITASIMANASGAVLDKVMEQVSALLNDAMAPLIAATDKLMGEGIKAAQKQLGDFGALLDPQMLLSIYGAVKNISNYDGMSVGAMLFSLFASPSIKLALYDNGDFYVPASSAKGENVALFKAAKDIQRYAITVSDPLSPFIGVIALGLALEIARHFVPEPATQEALRIAKIVAISGLSIAILVVKQDELQAYFTGPHREGIRSLYKNQENNRPLIENMLFTKPVVGIERF